MPVLVQYAQLAAPHILRCGHVRHRLPAASDRFFPRTTLVNLGRRGPPQMETGENANTARTMLLELLETSFTPAEFRRWILFLPESDKLLMHLPEAAQSPASFFAETLGVLLRRGAIQAYFFDLLQREFPRRKTDIERVRGAFGLAPSRDSAPSATHLTKSQPKWRLTGILFGILPIFFAALLVWMNEGARPAQQRTMESVLQTPEMPGAPGAKSTSIDDVSLLQPRDTATHAVETRPISPHPNNPPTPDKVKPRPRVRVLPQDDPGQKGATPARDPETVAPFESLAEVLATAVKECAWTNPNGSVSVTFGASEKPILSPRLKDYDSEDTRCIYGTLSTAWPAVFSAMKSAKIRSASVRFSQNLPPVIREVRSE